MFSPRIRGVLITDVAGAGHTWDGEKMHDTRSRRNRGTAAQADRKVETVAERSLRRSSTARMLAAESAGSRQGGPRRRNGPIHLYHAVVRSASLSAVGILAANFALTGLFFE